MINNNQSLLVDSQTLTWALFTINKISNQIQHQINSANLVSYSIASLWELNIKYRNGKFPYSTSEIIDRATQAGFQLLPITITHLLSLGQVKLPHKDPFDTMLVAQAQADNLILVTSDRHILQNYPNVINSAD